MQPNDRQPHIAGKRHQMKCQMLSTRTDVTDPPPKSDFDVPSSGQQLSGMICSYSEKKRVGFIKCDGVPADICFHLRHVTSRRSLMEQPIGRCVIFTIEGRNRAIDVHVMDLHVQRRV